MTTEKTDDAPRYSGGIVAALADFQAELPTIEKKSKANTGTFAYSYADLADVSAVVLPLLAKHGIAYTAQMDYDGESIILRASLMHHSGETLDCAWPIPRGSSQSMGSAVTYARRYCLLALTGVHPQGEDDDGAAAEHRKLARDTVATPKRATRSKTTKGEDDPWTVVPDPAAPTPTERDRWRLTDAQKQMMGAAFADLGLSKHRPLALAVTGKIIGRTIQSRDDLSQAETFALIDTLQAMRSDERWERTFTSVLANPDPLAALEELFPYVIDQVALDNLYAAQMDFPG